MKNFQKKIKCLEAHRYLCLALAIGLAVMTTGLMIFTPSSWYDGGKVPSELEIHPRTGYVINQNPLFWWAYTMLACGVLFSLLMWGISAIFYCRAKKLTIIALRRIDKALERKCQISQNFIDWANDIERKYNL